MKTAVLPSTPENIKKAARVIARGGLVGMPTETVYGLAADAFNETAVLGIFNAKGRPEDNPLIVHIDALEQLEMLTQRKKAPYVRLLIGAFWPGPLTLILTKSSCVPHAVTAGLCTVAVRMPDHPVARELIRRAKTPIAAPSANRSGKPSPTNAAHVYDDMNGRIPIILDAGQCAVGVESTVLDATGDAPRILRPGAVTYDMIKAIAGDAVVEPIAASRDINANKPRSPGMKYRHYAPDGNLILFRGGSRDVSGEIIKRYDQNPADSAVLALPKNRALYENRRVFTLGESDSMNDVAAGLFSALRLIDSEHINNIYAEAVDESQLGLAVMNRLLMAAAFHVVDA
jgi:L-threonylcarbamoyladenylate synthase